MGRLNFRDIQDWTPSAISVVDQPDHPLAVFEVYEDDDEFVKKSLDLSEVNIMSEKIDDVKVNEDQMVSGPVSFFEKLLGNVVTKSTEPPAEPPAKEPEKGNEESAGEKIMQKLEEMDKKIDAMDERITKLEGEEDPKQKEKKPPENNDDPVPGVVTKSKEVDPDNALKVTASEKTRMERMGRKGNGMTW